MFERQMLEQHIARRALLLNSLRAAGLCASASLLTAGDSNDPVSPFVDRYIQAMNAPGLTLAMADRQSTVRTAAFGLSDLEAKLPVTPAMLFEIGSITKSFVALTLLQLREEGKFDLNRPVLYYLPWLPIDQSHGTITARHLLTHTSGLPNSLQLFPSDPAKRHVQAFAPGERFSYCNLGFEILGFLIAKIDGRPWPIAIRERIFTPLGMTSSIAVVSEAIRSNLTPSYIPYCNDKVYHRDGRLIRTGARVFENAAGSIASNSADMALYMRMLLNRGEGPHGRIVSPESFALFSKPNAKAPDLSPTASYGFGIGVDLLDGHTILRHTGGTVSFMSAMHVDLDAGVAAFASINAMLGYRPNLVTEYAVRFLRAKKEEKNVPQPPGLPDPSVVRNSHEYAGRYISPAGKSIDVTGSGDTLTMTSESRTFPLKTAGPDVFLSTDPEFQDYPLVFGREELPKDSKAKPSVQDLLYGPDWFVNQRYKGPKSFAAPPAYQAFVGHYCGDSPWIPSARVFIQKDKLSFDGAELLTPLGQNLFRMGETDEVEFSTIVDGKAQLLTAAGQELRRVEFA